MPVREYRMKPGSWVLNLVADTPSRLLDQIAVERFGFGQLLILPAHLDPRDVSDSELLQRSRYTGLYTGMEGRNRLTGAHIHTLLAGDILESPVWATPNGYLSQWFAALAFSSFPNLTVTGPGGAYTGSFHRVNRLEAWETLCAHFGVEWRVRPDLGFEVGPAATLYGATPSLVVLRNAGWGGRDHGLTGVQGTAKLAVDTEDYANKVVFLSGDRDTPTVTTATTASPYTNPAGGPLIMDRLVEDYSATDPGPQAAARLAEVDHPRYELQVDSDVYDVGYLAPVGAPVYVYDPIGGASDYANPVAFRGGTIFPMTTRVTGMSWPIRAGMGVYLRRHDGTKPVYVDLTPYVEFETGTATLEVGAVPRPSR